jgi:hypothetical protein
MDMGMVSYVINQPCVKAGRLPAWQAQQPDESPVTPAPMLTDFSGMFREAL